jgi:hypothetical protein
MAPSSRDRDSTSEHTAAADSQLSSVATTRSDDDARRAIEEYLLTSSEQYRELAKWRREVSIRGLSHRRLADSTPRSGEVGQPTGTSLGSVQMQIVQAESHTQTKPGQPMQILPAMTKAHRYRKRPRRPRISSTT